MLPTKQRNSIRSKDYQTGNVTIRKSEPICGKKALVIINRQGLITHGQLFHINQSDHNFLKQPLLLMTKKLLSGLLLADRGFNNKTVRKAFKQIGDNEQFSALPKTRLISPYHTKEVASGKTLSQEEWSIYGKRWKIETVFQRLKSQFGNHKLSLGGLRKEAFLEAKFFIALISYNFSRC